ncbi:MAG TPA: hypothetical protein PKD18_01390 [Saprospiraceae bacterium]|nr:hypothetical protein [Saprospiraceae bacterium]
MRNLFLLSILIMHCALNLNAKSLPICVDTPPFVESNGKGSVTLHLESWISDSVKVSFFQDGQALLFEETLLTERDVRTVDFADLPNGIYVFEIEDKLKMVQQKVFKTPEEVMVMPQIAYLYKPIFKESNTHWLVSMFTQGAGCTINILDPQNNIIHLEALPEGQPYVIKSFNHSLLQPGLYTVKFVVSNRVFSREYFIEPKSIEVVVKL